MLAYALRENAHTVLYSNCNTVLGTTLEKHTDGSEGAVVVGSHMDAS